MPEKSTQRPLVTVVIFFHVLCVFSHTHEVRQEGSALLVQTVVRQVGKGVIDPSQLRVAFGCKPRQSLVVHIYSQRIIRRDQHVDPQVELQVVDEQWIADILADDAARVHGQLCHAVDLHDIGYG